MRSEKPKRVEADVINRLKKVMSKFSDVQLAYLFGSYAEGRGMPTSDLDIAILTREKRVVPYLTAEISNALNLPEGRISILNIEDTVPSIRLRVLSRGVKILDRGVYEEELKKGLDPETIDLIEGERAGFYAWLKGNPLNESLLKRILVQLSEDVEDLKDLLKKSPSEVLRDRYLRKAFERTMQTSIEGAIDMLRHVISGLNLGVAEYYKDYVEICRDKGVINAETANKLLELIPARHSLVHRYREVNYEKLWAEAKVIVDTIPKLQEEVRNYLKKALEGEAKKDEGVESPLK